MYLICDSLVVRVCGSVHVDREVTKVGDGFMTQVHTFDGPTFSIRFFRSWTICRNILLWRLILSLAVNLQPPSMCVFVSGDWHLVHMKVGLCFLLHLWMCTPHTTSRESLLALKGAVEYAWIAWSETLALGLL